jgi:hypothetical protein
VNALVMPHAPPETTSTPAPSTANVTAPTHIGHDPRRIRATPRAVGGTPAGGGLRRACTARLIATTTSSTAIVTAHDPNHPMCSDSTTAGSAGRSATNG